MTTMVETENGKKDENEMDILRDNIDRIRRVREQKQMNKIERPVAMPPIFEFSGIEILNYYANSKKFRKIIDSGKYVYAGNRLVLMSHECVRVIDGEVQVILEEPRLNDYCLKIKRTLIRTTTGRKTGGRYLRCGSPIQKRIEYELEEAAKIKSIADITIDNIRLLFGGGDDRPDPPNKFSDALVYFMERKGYTNERLASETGLSEKTIQRMRTGEVNPEVETVVAVCVGLHLGPYYSLLMLAKARHHLIDTDYDYALFCCILYGFSCSVESCNYMMLNLGHKPLTNLYDMDKFKNAVKLGIGIPGVLNNIQL